MNNEPLDLDRLEQLRKAAFLPAQPGDMPENLRGIRESEYAEYVALSNAAPTLIARARRADELDRECLMLRVRLADSMNDVDQLREAGYCLDQRAESAESRVTELEQMKSGLLMRVDELSIEADRWHKAHDGILSEAARTCEEAEKGAAERIAELEAMIRDQRVQLSAVEAVNADHQRVVESLRDMLAYANARVVALSGELEEVRKDTARIALLAAVNCQKCLDAAAQQVQRSQQSDGEPK